MMFSSISDASSLAGLPLKYKLRIRFLFFAFLPGTLLIGDVCMGSFAGTDRASVKVVNEDEMRNCVFHLKSFGNRTSWKKQWAAANWLKGKLEKLELAVHIQCYSFAALADTRNCGELHE